MSPASVTIRCYDRTRDALQCRKRHAVDVTRVTDTCVAVTRISVTCVVVTRNTVKCLTGMTYLIRNIALSQ